MSEASCVDPETGKARLLSSQCATCIYRPGNLMHLRPGVLRQMTSDALREGSQGIICHDTLPYGRSKQPVGALCRGFYEKFGHLNNYVRIMQRLGGFTEVQPPDLSATDRVREGAARLAVGISEASRPKK